MLSLIQGVSLLTFLISAVGLCIGYLNPEFAYPFSRESGHRVRTLSGLAVLMILSVGMVIAIPIIERARLAAADAARLTRLRDGLPHSDPTDPARVESIHRVDTVRVGSNHFVVSTWRQPTERVVGVPVYAEPDTIFQYYQDNTIRAVVSANGDTVYDQVLGISDVIPPPHTDSYTGEPYVLMSVRIEPGSDHVQLIATAYVPDTDISLDTTMQVYP